MVRSTLTLQQRKADKDLNIIGTVTFLVLVIFIGFQNQFLSFADNQTIPVLLRTFTLAFMQFGVAGLGITIVSLLRKERFLKYGLRREGIVKSIVLSIFVFIPSIVFYIVTGKADSYLPFQSVSLTKEALAEVFPVKIIGMGMITAAWGFFEGFNYVVISEKINIRFPSQRKWLNWGALTCALMCLLIHGMIGVTAENIIEDMTTFIIIYGMLLIKEYTGNAWGCIFIFVFLWNAF